MLLKYIRPKKLVNIECGQQLVRIGHWFDAFLKSLKPKQQ